METGKLSIRAAELVATGFGCGYAPIAPGTAASLAAVAVAAVLETFCGWRPWHLAVLAAAWLPLGVWSAGAFARRIGRDDPPSVVIDELLGQWVTLAAATAVNWKGWLAGFLLFRLFDIWKPPPVRQLERLEGGAGIVADDIMAGLYAALVLYTAGCFNLY